MSIIFYIMNYLGINLNVESADPFVSLLSMLCFLSLIGLLSIINISIYLMVIYFSNNEKIIKILSRWKYVFFIFNIYKKTRVFFIVSEILIFLISQLTVIYICVKCIKGLL